MLRASFSAILANLDEIRNFVERAAHELQVPEAATLDVVQAVDEAATNIILHGYNGQGGMMEVELDRRNNSLVVCLRDGAPPFDPTSVPPPDLSLGLEQRLPGGLGLYLMRHLVDEIQYRMPSEGGNELTLIKKLSIKENHQ